MDKPEALRLADLLESCPLTVGDAQQAVAAAELRRLHAENASLAAALASSCDEQRHQLWESGGIAGCDRARVAERQRDALLEALQSIADCCDEEHAARDYASRQTEIRGIARAAIRARTP